MTEETLADKIGDILEYRAMPILRCPGETLKQIWHIIKWIPTLWNDRDWDQVYMWIILRKKLSMMRHHHEHHRVIADWGKVAHQLEVAELLLTRIIDDNYGMDDYLAIREKYGERKLEPTPDGHLQMSEVSNEERKELDASFAREEYLRNQDMDTLLSHIKKHSRTWWD